jgi:hypothetical protein
MINGINDVVKEIEKSDKAVVVVIDRDYISPTHDYVKIPRVVSAKSIKELDDMQAKPLKRALNHSQLTVEELKRERARAIDRLYRVDGIIIDTLNEITMGRRKRERIESAILNNIHRLA